MIVLLCKVSSLSVTRESSRVLMSWQSPLTKKYDLTSVIGVMSGAAPMSAELTRQFVEVLPNAHIGQGYGRSLHPCVFEPT